MVHGEASFLGKRKKLDFKKKNLKQNSLSQGTCVKSGTGSSSSSLDMNSHTSISKAVSNFEPK